MANIPIRSMTQTGTPDAASQIVFDNGVMRRGTVASMADAVRPVASLSEAQVGTDNAKTMTPLRVKDSVAVEITASYSATATLTNKTFDTLGAGNVFRIAGSTINAITGTGSAVLATSPTLITPNLGTPSAITLTNATGLPIASGVAGLAAGVAAFLAAPSSANLRTALTDETGTGSAVFGTSPNITAPTGIVKGDVGLGNVDNTSDVTKWAATKTLTNTTYDTAGTGNSLSIAGVAVTANTGTGAVVRATSPTLVTPNLGTPSAVNLANGTALPVGGVSGLGTGVATFLAAPTSANLAAALSDETGTGSAVFANAPTLVNPVVGTQAPGNNTTLAASTGFVTAAVAASTAGVASYEGRTGTVVAIPADRINMGAVGVVKVQSFTASGTYTPSAGLLYAIVRVVGGGGGGGAAQATAAGNFAMAGGGGGGGGAEAVLSAATIGASQTVTIGASGAGGVYPANGSAGGTTSFGALVIASGGSGGLTATSTTLGLINGGAGGVGTAGTVQAKGGTGSPGFNFYPNGGIAGYGGSSGLYGSGGAITSTFAGTGASASGPGGGGGGASNNASVAAANGGAGAAGRIDVYEFCNQ